VRAKLFYYFLVVPVSALPLWFLYGIGRVFLFFLYYVFGYRKKVVAKNLKRVFPNLSRQELEDLMLRFYKHLADIFAEGVKGYTIAKQNLKRRFLFTNPEVVDALYDQNKSVLLVGAHYNNWEFLVLSLNLHFKHQGTGVGQNISNKSFGAMMKKVRSRFYMEVWTNKNVRTKIEEYQSQNRLFCCLLLADQNPSSADKAYWMEFLNQRTPVIFGPEYLAKKYDLPVFYYSVTKQKRGYYAATLVPITLAPSLEPEGDITYRHAKLLEADILAKPEFWLWSHKRWKNRHHGTKRSIRK
jgi:KDO2-lipid IV(A) lauroyltransferase